MKAKQINKVSVVISDYTKPKKEHKRDNIVCGYVYEKAKLIYGFDRPSDNRENIKIVIDNKITRQKAQIKKVAFNGLQANKLASRLKQIIVSDDEVNIYVQNLINKDLEIKDKDIKNFFA